MVERISWCLVVPGIHSFQGRNRDQRYPPPGRARGMGGNRQWDEYEDNTGYGYKGGKKNFRNRY